jgi:hypothetical protein
MSDLAFTDQALAGRSPRLRRIRRAMRRAPLWLILPLLCLGGGLAATGREGLPIRWDGLGYYSWTEAILHDDFGFCQWRQERAVAALSARNPQHPSRCENRYPAGLAVLRLPVMGPVAMLSDHESDRTLNISGAEEQASSWLGLAALLGCALLMWATLRRLAVRDRPAQAVVLAVVFGTGLFDYGTVDASFTHVYSATLLAGLVHAGVTARQRRREPHPLLVFTLSLFIAWLRQPDIAVLALLGVAWIAVGASASGREGRRPAIRSVAVAVGAIVLTLAIQVAYSRWATGTWTLNSYGSEQLSWSRGDELRVLFSYHHGLLTWYPVVGLLLAVGLANRASRPWTALAALALGALTLIYGSWDSWYLGVGMGLRGMVDVVPLIAIAGGIGLSGIARRARPVVLAAMAALTLATVELMLAYWSGAIPYGAVTAAQYWQVVVGRHSVLHL